MADSDAPPTGGQSSGIRYEKGLMSPEYYFLLEWYQGYCGGEWEHTHGITVETLYAPGWLVTIDLDQTLLAEATMVPVRYECSATDWLLCEVQGKTFRGQGDPGKLSRILSVFQQWVKENATVK